MTNPHSLIKRLLLAGGLALGVLATAALSGAPAGADSPQHAAGRTPTPPPATATPTATAGGQGLPTLCPPSGCVAPPISPIQVTVDGTTATITFHTLEPAAVTINYKPAGGSGAGGQAPAQGYATVHERTLTGLTANTTYDVTITATTKAGKQHSTQTRVTVASLIRGLTSQVGGTFVSINFTTTEPALVTVAYKPADGSGASGQAPAQGWETTHERRLTGLKSNTTYDVTVTAEAADGRKDTITPRFTTLKQRLRVTLREIEILDDGDGLFSGDGEPQWVVTLQWAGGKVGGCYPNNGSFCEYGSHGKGRFFPRNFRGESLVWLFAAEQFDALPTSLTIAAAAEEYDIVSGPCGLDIPLGCGFCANQGSGSWPVPQGVEWASTPVTVSSCTENGNFRSRLTFTFDVFYDNLSYPSARNKPSTTWK